MVNEAYIKHYNIKGENSQILIIASPRPLIDHICS